jgi:RNA polymerase sigma-70 factor (ECF subfamily)
VNVGLTGVDYLGSNPPAPRRCATVPDRRVPSLVVDEATQLALAARVGDDRALSRFISVTQADVWRFCAHLVSPAQADDLTQDVYLRAMRSLASFRGDASARTWLLAIARRVIADHYRSRRRHRRVLGEPIEMTTGGPALHGELSAALRALDADRHSAFVLTQVLGLSYAEAAGVCGCPVGTIRSRVARARADLVAFLEDDGLGVEGRG